MSQRLTGALSAVSQLTANVSAIILLAVTGLLLTDVVLRAVYQPILGSQEMAEMAMVMMLFGALSLIEAKGKQIRVDLLTPNLGPKLCLWIDRLSYALGALLWTTLAFATWELAGFSALLNMSSNLIGIPRAPFQYVLCAMAALTALTSIAQIFAQSSDGEVNE